MHQALFYKHKKITLTTEAGFLKILGKVKHPWEANDQNWEDLRILEYKWETVGEESIQTQVVEL